MHFEYILIPVYKYCLGVAKYCQCYFCHICQSHISMMSETGLEAYALLVSVEDYLVQLCLLVCSKELFTVASLLGGLINKGC